MITIHASVNNDFANAWLKDFASEQLLAIINKKIQNKIPSLRIKVQEFIYQEISANQTIMELLTFKSKLIGEVGEPNGKKRKVRDLLNRLCESVTITFQHFRLVGNHIKGKLQIQAIKSDYQDILDIGIVQSKSGPINWLDWLLFYGSMPVAIGYELRDKTNIPDDVLERYSRTGVAIMLPNKSKSFSISSEYQGSLHDNFITASSRRINELVAKELLGLL